MIALALLAVAAAAELDTHWYGMLGEGNAIGGGVGFGMFVPVGDVGGELAFDVGALRPEAIDWHLRGGARVYPMGFRADWRASVALGPGVRARGVGPWDPAPYVFTQVAVDTPRIRNLRVRLSLEAIASPGRPIEGRLGMAVLIPLVLDRGYPPDTPPPGTVADASPDLPGGRAFIPHPVCRWVPLSSLPTWLDRVPPGTVIRVDAPGYLPTEVKAGPDAAVSLEEAPERGAVVVAAYPGDIVRLGDGDWVAPSDGVVTTNVGPGNVTIGVIGNGRADRLEAAVVDGYGAWVSVLPPPPIRIQFAVSSSDLDDADRERITDTVELAGEGRFTVSGSHSPEGGEDRNAELARLRAEAVVAALVEAGLDPARVTVEAAGPPDASLSPHEQRAAVISPVLP